jgi:hypothetical protein
MLYLILGVLYIGLVFRADSSRVRRPGAVDDFEQVKSKILRAIYLGKLILSRGTYPATLKF